MSDARHPKEILHDAIQESLADERIAGALVGGHLTRWVLVAEAALTDDRTGLLTASSTAGNMDMTAWDRSGFLITALLKVNR